MRRNKKGDLAISTNAIVILIIAVIMLGLIIGFATRGFNSASRKVLEKAESDEAEAPTPSLATPITASRTNMLVGAGEFQAIKIKVRSSADITGAVPSISCNGATGGGGGGAAADGTPGCLYGSATCANYCSVYPADCGRCPSCLGGGGGGNVDAGGVLAGGLTCNAKDVATGEVGSFTCAFQVSEGASGINLCQISFGNERPLDIIIRVE